MPWVDSVCLPNSYGRRIGPGQGGKMSNPVIDNSRLFPKRKEKKKVLIRLTGSIIELKLT